MNWLYQTVPAESISVNKIPLLFRLPSLLFSEWQLCFSCQYQLNLAPVNKHHGGLMEMSRPSSGPKEDDPFQQFPNPKTCKFLFFFLLLHINDQQITLPSLSVWRPLQVRAQVQVQVQVLKRVSLIRTDSCKGFLLSL